MCDSSVYFTVCTDRCIKDTSSVFWLTFTHRSIWKSCISRHFHFSIYDYTFQILNKKFRFISTYVYTLPVLIGFSSLRNFDLLHVVNKSGYQSAFSLQHVFLILVFRYKCVKDLFVTVRTEDADSPRHRLWIFWDKYKWRLFSTKGSTFTACLLGLVSQLVECMSTSVQLSAKILNQYC